MDTPKFDLLMYTYFSLSIAMAMGDKDCYDLLSYPFSNTEEKFYTLVEHVYSQVVLLSVT